MAFTTAVVEDVTLGAVNTPVLEMLPIFTDQVTVVLVVLLTVAANCCVHPERTLALLGETETEIAAGGLTETAALAYFVVSAELIAFTVTVVVAVTAGAVN